MTTILSGAFPECVAALIVPVMQDLRDGRVTAEIELETLLRAAAAAPAGDPFRGVRDATTEHRRAHGCQAYTYDKGSFLFALVAARKPARVLELGTALGYTALCLASAGAHVDTIEADPVHADLARREIARRDGLSIAVHHGDFETVLKRLAAGYDLAFFDGFEPTGAIYRELCRVLAPRAVLVSANLNHGGGREYHARILDEKVWVTRFIDRRSETALSVHIA